MFRQQPFVGQRVTDDRPPRPQVCRTTAAAPTSYMYVEREAWAMTAGGGAPAQASCTHRDNRAMADEDRVEEPAASCAAPHAPCRRHHHHHHHQQHLSIYLSSNWPMQRRGGPPTATPYPGAAGLGACRSGDGAHPGHASRTWTVVTPPSRVCLGETRTASGGRTLRSWDPIETCSRPTTTSYNKKDPNYRT
eukprot:scaffold3296_cov405-Prasinococcus_capsulatus_cf.AAC.11